MINYKQYTIKTTGNESYIYEGSTLRGCTFSDHNKNNSEEKAKKRIDENRINNLNK